ncbi:MAG: RNA polymerase sigma factor [Gammaproteobacteria bacterium]
MPEHEKRLSYGRRLLALAQACRVSLARGMARLVNRHDVDDILQEAFNRARDDGGGKPTLRSQPAFFLRTATAMAMNRFSRSGPRPNAQLEDLSVPEVSQIAAESEESQLDGSQRFVTFCRAVGGLPEECRRVIVLKKVYGLSVAEIADHLDVAVSLVEKDMARALMMCRDYLENASRPQPGSGGEPDARKSGSST